MRTRARNLGCKGNAVWHDRGGYRAEDGAGRENGEAVADAGGKSSGERAVEPPIEGGRSINHQGSMGAEGHLEKRRGCLEVIVGNRYAAHGPDYGIGSGGGSLAGDIDLEVPAFRTP